MLTKDIIKDTDANKYIDVTNNKLSHLYDVVIPNNNEEEFIDMAVILGYKNIVFLTNNINYKKISSSKILIKTAYLIKDPSEIALARRKFDLIVAISERKYFESKIDIILYSEESDRKDSFHYRSTSLNQVHAQLSKQNNISICINFGSLLENSKNIEQLGKMMQNSRLIRKYKLKYNIFSLAQRPEFMRSKIILDSLGKVLKI
ncbi:MAG: hypothetical protein ACP5N1_07085 [Candidatus Woesearchaeota archaeon]